MAMDHKPDTPEATSEAPRKNVGSTRSRCSGPARCSTSCQTMTPVTTYDRSTAFTTRTHRPHAGRNVHMQIVACQHTLQQVQLLARDCSPGIAL